MNLRTLKKLYEAGYTIPSSTILDPLFLDAGIAVRNQQIVAFGEGGFKSYSDINLPGSTYKGGKFTVKSVMETPSVISDKAKGRLKDAYSRIKHFIVASADRVFLDAYMHQLGV